ncbi:MAG: PDZ domain-containing protein, partial [Clostridia bacterium]|nr:PDZ domain-containing protein [Clostridia bacterium]
TIAKGNSASNQEYTYIYDVVENGVADQAGIKKNDIIIGIKVNGEDLITVDTYEEINQTMSALVVGDVLVLKIQRTLTPNQIITKDITMDITQFRFCDTGM